ncbi:MAG: DUF1501 domain-containing protein [Planctomycetes bacterium]|nr:DUF1501 domain-containing protein [Planctomycetota bacterium]
MNHGLDPWAVSRRWFLGRCGFGLGAAALAGLGAPLPGAGATGTRAPRRRVRNVIFLFMAGGPSQLELFDWKPELQRRHGEPVPASLLAGKRFAFMDSYFARKLSLLGTTRRFARHGERGTWVSELLPCTARVVDHLAIVRTLQTDVPNHGPAKAMLNTGFFRYGRPSMGAWVLYGLGSESRDLPGFVVLASGVRGPRGGALNWNSGFLPTVHQGVPFRPGAEPIPYLRRPAEIAADTEAETVAGIAALNRERLAATGDPEIATRIAQYEMAFRMQARAPELLDLQGESRAVLDLYGVEPGQPSFAANCLLARRMVERGVRFVQLYHTNWDSHGGPRENLTTDLERVCHDVDRGCAALVLDLHARGLLDETLVVWSGEFGRTPIGEPRETVGRNHHVEAGTFWLAGGGVRPMDLGRTDELGYASVEDPVHVHDLQATILHLLGIDHEQLTFRHQGREFRLTDVGGRVVGKLLG